LSVTTVEPLSVSLKVVKPLGPSVPGRKLGFSVSLMLRFESKIRLLASFARCASRIGYDGGGVGKGGTATLYIDGEAVGDGRIEQTEAFLFSADETTDVGDEYGSPVTTDYGQRRFSGEVRWVELDVGLDDHNHMIAPEDRVHLAMGLQ
jgi:hypothetical protein